MKTQIIISIVFIFFSNIIIGQTYTLDVQVEGFKGDGNCVFSLFVEDNSFEADEESYKRASVQIDSGKCSYTFQELPKGDYAVIVYHDENSDGELETNFIGMPQEGIGNSNNYRGMPLFEKSKIKVNSNKSILITIRYL